MEGKIQLTMLTGILLGLYIIPLLMCWVWDMVQISRNYYSSTGLQSEDVICGILVFVIGLIPILNAALMVDAIKNKYV